MEDKKVSIIVPVYNTAKYLPKCLDSLINQTYNNIEIICVNDGSTDSSLEILHEYAKEDSRVVVVDSENSGVSIARNKALDIATGEYIMFVDSDDWVDNSFVELLMNEVYKENAQIVKCCYSKEFATHSVVTSFFNEPRIVLEEKEIKEKIHRRLFGLLGEELARPQDCDIFASLCVQIISNELCKARMFDIRKIATAEDLLYNMDVYRECKKFVYVNIPLYHYRKDNEASITTKYKPELYNKWQNLFDVISEKAAEINNCDYFNALNNRVALSVIGVGLNEIKADKNIFEKAKFLKEVLKTTRYKLAFKNLEMKYFPIHWWVFFALCKLRFTFLLVVMLEIIEFLRKRVKR